MNRFHRFLALFALGSFFYGVCAGALCDLPCSTNVTHDSEILDYAPIITKALRGGCKVQLSIGSFPIKSNIWFRNGSCLIGTGSRSLAVIDSEEPSPHTELIYSQTQEGLDRDEGLLHLNGVSNITITNISLSLDSHASTHCDTACLFGVKIKGGCTNVTLSHVMIWSATKDGIDVSDSNNVELRHVRIHLPDRHGVVINRTNATMENVIVKYSRGDGFRVADGSNATITNSFSSMLEGPSRACGVFLDGREDSPVKASISGMMIWSAVHAGICAESAELRVENTRIHNTWKGTCFDTKNLTTFVVSNNICTDEHQYTYQRPTLQKDLSLTAGTSTIGNTKSCGSECKTDTAFDPNVSDYGKVLSKALKAGCMVRLLAGEYPVKTNIKFTSNSCLVGTGTNSTHLLAPEGYCNEGTIDEPGSGGQGVLHIDGVQNVEVSNMTININCCQLEKLCVYGVKIKSDSRNVSLTNVRIKNGGRNSVRIQDSTNILLQAVLAFDPEHTCVRVLNSSSTILNSVAGFCNMHGFHVSRGSNISLQSSSAVNFEAYDNWPTGCGAIFSDTDRHLGSARVDNFTVWDVGAGGICAKKTRLSVVNSKFFEVNENKCFRLANLPEFMVSNNTWSTDIVYDGQRPS